MSRRRALLMALLSTANYAAGFYILDETIVFPLNKRYGVRLYISKSYYYYESDYPMYIFKVSDTSYYLVFAVGYLYRNGSAYAPNTPIIGTKNGISYAREGVIRNIPYSTAYTNYNIEFWG